MRTGLFFTFLACTALTLVIHVLLPPEVALHFGGGGRPDGWGPKIVHTLLFLGLNTFLYLLFALLPRLVARMPKELINLPNKEYWLSPEHRQEALGRMETRMAEFGMATLVFMAGAMVLTARANLREPVVLEEGWFLTGLALYLLFTGVWCARLYREFRVPSYASGDS